MMRMKVKVQHRKGVTLVTLLIVIVILGALAAIAIPRIITSSNTAKSNACATNINTINTQIELYYVNNDAWPTDINDVTASTAYFPDGEPTCPSGGTYTMDDTLHRVSCDATGH